jgi:hypothetical protein
MSKTSQVWIFINILLNLKDKENLSVILHMIVLGNRKSSFSMQLPISLRENILFE